MFKFKILSRILVPAILVLLTAFSPEKTVYGTEPSKAISSDPDDIFWDGRFDSLGVDGTVLALAVDGSDIYVGGSFSMAGKVAANNIARWDGSSWSTLGTGASNGTDGNVLAIEVDEGNVYVGGSFTSAGGVAANNIAVWDGSTWTALGSGVDGDVRAISAATNVIYVGGLFTSVGGNTANQIAKWDGNAWSSLSTGAANGVNAPVLAIATKDNLAYVGGSFTTAGGESANKIVMWDNSSLSWSPLGSGVSLGDVNTIAINQDTVYVGGLFTTAGGVDAKKIAKWDGSNWTSVGSGMTGGDVNGVAMLGDTLFAAGSFSAAGGISAEKIAKWDGSSWAALGSGIDGGLVFALAISTTNVYVGGSFSSTGGKPVKSFGLWTESDDAVPVELVSFTATVNGNFVELRWRTVSEENNFGFQIERMMLAPPTLGEEPSQSEQTNWQEVAFVKGHGTTLQPHDYSYKENVESLIKNVPRTLKYRLKQIDFDGSFEYSDPIKISVGQKPDEILLAQNYPNPFNPQTKIEFYIPKAGFTTLKIYNMLGQEIRTLIDEELPAGGHTLKFEAGNLPNGVYVYVLRSGNPPRSTMKRMLLLK